MLSKSLRFRSLVLALVLVMTLLAQMLAPAGSVAAAYQMSLSPAAVSLGYESPVTVTVTGTGTQFVPGGTTVTLFSGATNTGAVSNVSVAGPGSLSFTLATGLAAGSYTLSIRTSQAVWEKEFTVTVPTVGGAEPNSVAVGYAQPVAVSLLGSGTTWAAGQTTVTLLSGGESVGTVSGLHVASATALSFNIGTGIAAGAYTIRVATGSEVVTTPFTVRAPTVGLSRTTATAGYSSAIAVTATGSETNFVSGATTVSILQGGAVAGSTSGLAVSSTSSLSFNIGTGLSAGSYTIRIATGAEYVEAPFTVLTPSVSLSVSAANAGYASPITVTATGTNTSFATGQSAVALLNAAGDPAGTVSSLAVSSATALSFSLPTGLAAGSYTVRISTGDQTVSAPFTVRQPSVSLTPSGAAQGYAGSLSVTATGVYTDFAATTQVQLLTAASTLAATVGAPAVTSATQLSFTIPNGVGAGSYTVRITTGSQVVTVPFEVASRVLTFGTAASTITANTRSGAMTLEVRDSANAPSQATESIIVHLSSTSADGRFYAAATGGSAITSIIIGVGTSSTVVYYEDSLPGTPLITAQAPGFGQTTKLVTVQPVTVAAIGTSGASTMTAGIRSDLITLQLQDGAGLPAVAASSLTVNLAISQETGLFYTQSVGGAAVTSLTVPAGSSTASLYYQETRAPSATLTFTVGAVATTRVINVLPASPTRLAFTQLPASVAAGVRSEAISLQLQDTYGNPKPADGALAVTLTANTTTGRFYLEPSGGQPVTQGSIPSGQHSLSLYFEDTRAGTASLTGSAAGLTGAGQVLTVLPGPATRLVVTTDPRVIAAGARSGGITIMRQDAHANPVEIQTALTVTLASNSATGAFYLSATGGAPVTTAQIPAGKRTVTVYYQDTKAGQATINAAAAGLTGAAQSATVIPGPATALAFITPARSAQINVRTAAITLELQDAYQNPVPSGEARTTEVISSGQAGHFYSVAAGGNPETLFTVAQGQSSITFYYADPVSGSFVLSTVSTGLPTATQPVTVTAATAPSPPVTDPDPTDPVVPDPEDPAPAEPEEPAPVVPEPAEPTVPTTGLPQLVVRADGTASLTQTVQRAQIDLTTLTTDLVLDLAGAPGETAPLTSRTLRLPVQLLTDLQSTQHGVQVDYGVLSLRFAADLVSSMAPVQRGEEVQLQVQVETLSAAAATLELRPTGPVLRLQASLATMRGEQIPITQLTRPVTLRIPFTGAGNPNHLGVYRFDPLTAAWMYQGGKVNLIGGYVEVALNSFSDYTLMEYTRTFADVPPGHWAKVDVEMMAARHVARGIEGNFQPAGLVTRAQFAALMVRTLRLETPQLLFASFVDVKASDWFFAEVETAARAGLIQGFAGQFRPEDPITRQEMAVILSRALQLMGHERAHAPSAALLVRFTDRASIAPWSLQSVGTAVDLGLMQGRSADRFDPDENASRAEATVVLARLLRALGLI